ncbi:hypothetical protein LX32DRAFT_682789 [Colletotrichum zoysiae]|uniref:Uncharacterized protein n=1 Tax=Colletotrichum zoysiae TaxID=1216348 RepID=A0AAD9M1X2_9PEZI|nr:hypothetical protein LX32DRAFT_682789 [Colletotrichum zoysiae]
MNTMAETRNPAYDFCLQDERCDCSKCAAKSGPVAESPPDQELRESVSRLERCQKDAEKKRAAYDAWGRDSDKLCETLAREEALILTYRSMIDAAHDRCSTAHQEYSDRWGPEAVAKVHREYTGCAESLTDARLEVEQAYARFGRVHLESKLAQKLRERLANMERGIGGGGLSSAAAAAAGPRGQLGPEAPAKAMMAGWLSSSTAVTDSAGDDVSTLPPSEVSPSLSRRKRRAAEWKSGNGRRDHQTATGGAPMKQGAPTKRDTISRGRGSRYQPYRR